jgi:polygalacturonase
VVIHSPKNAPNTDGIDPGSSTNVTIAHCYIKTGVQGAGKITLQGYDAQHRLGMTFDNVQFDSLADIKFIAEHADLKFGPGPVNLKVSGDGVTVTGAPSSGKPNACADKFAPMPER